VAPQPFINGSFESWVKNPYQSVTVSYDVSQFPGAARVYVEFSQANREFSNPNGNGPDPFRQTYTYGPPGRGQVYFQPVSVLPGWGTYSIRIVPLDANYNGLSLLSNSSRMMLRP
jgi:hypothetical protein